MFIGDREFGLRNIVLDIDGIFHTPPDTEIAFEREKIGVRNHQIVTVKIFDPSSPVNFFNFILQGLVLEKKLDVFLFEMIFHFSCHLQLLGKTETLSLFCQNVGQFGHNIFSFPLGNSLLQIAFFHLVFQLQNGVFIAIFARIPVDFYRTGDGQQRIQHDRIDRDHTVDIFLSATCIIEILGLFGIHFEIRRPI